MKWGMFEIILSVAGLLITLIFILPLPSTIAAAIVGGLMTVGGGIIGSLIDKAIARRKEARCQEGENE